MNNIIEQDHWFLKKRITASLGFRSGAGYCDDRNRRFAVDAASDADYHPPMPSATKLREIFRMETERTLGNDWVVRHENHFYQVEAGAGITRRPRARAGS